MKHLVVNRIDYHFGRIGRHTDIMTRIFKEASDCWAGWGWDTATGLQDWDILGASSRWPWGAASLGGSTGKAQGCCREDCGWGGEGLPAGGAPQRSSSCRWPPKPSLPHCLICPCRCMMSPRVLPPLRLT